VFLYEKEAGFIQDREDLISVLRMRFGDIHPRIIMDIYELNELDTLERLILVAANAPSFAVFLEELAEGTESFRIVGDQFNPIEAMLEGDGSSGQKK